MPKWCQDYLLGHNLEIWSSYGQGLVSVSFYEELFGFIFFFLYSMENMTQKLVVTSRCVFKQSWAIAMLLKLSD